MKRSKARQIDIDLSPAWVWYVPDEAAWVRLRKRYKLDLNVPFPYYDASCTHIENVDVGLISRPNFILITVNRNNRHREVQQVAGLIAHECMHAWRYIRKAMRETKPSLEFEAYMLQSLVRQVTQNYLKTTRKPWKALT